MEIKSIKNEANQLLGTRCSIRKYDTSVKISREELSAILQDAQTAPSSLNLQPWRTVVVDTEEGKELIRPYVMFNQQQLDTCSAMIAVFGDMESYSYTEQIYAAAVEKGIMPEDAKTNMVGMINGYAANLSVEQKRNTVLIDSGAFCLQIMLAAKGYGYDTNPIGGYMKEEVTAALGMDKDRYIPIMLISIGKAAEPYHDSIRFSVDEITQWR